MKNHRLSLSCFLKNLFIVTLLTLYGTDAWSQSNNAKLRFYSPFVLALGYERVTQQNKSVLFNVRAGLYDFSDRFGFPKGESYSANIGFRYYLASNKTMNGFYFEGALGAGLAKSSGSRYIGTEQVVFAFSVVDVPKYAKGTAELVVGKMGLNIGYQKRWNVFSADLGVGIQHNIPIEGDLSIPLSDGTKLELPNYTNGLEPKAYLGIGFAF